MMFNALTQGMYNYTDKFNVRSIIQVLKIAVKKWMRLVDGSVQKIKSVLNSLREIVKSKGFFYVVAQKLNQGIELPGMDFETRCSSAFDIISKAYAARRVIHDVVKRIDDI